jgi:hypothetical protein
VSPRLANISFEGRPKSKPKIVVWSLGMGKVIKFLRVSTHRQHRSGLGIDAQRTAIERFETSESLKIAAEYIEADREGLRRLG